MKIDFEELLKALPVKQFIAIILFFVLERHISAFIWNAILRELGNKKIAIRDTTEVYLKSNLGKYLPGNVMHYAGRNIIGGKYKLHQGDMVLATILEIGTMLIAVAILLVAVGFHTNIELIQSFVANKIVMYISVISVVAIGLIFLAMKMKQRVCDYLSKILCVRFIITLSIIIILRMTMMFIAGITFAGILQTMTIIIDWLTVAKIYCFAWVLGFVVPGAPGGLGVRETVLIISLAALPQETLMLAIIWHRIATILADFVSFGMAFAWKRKDKQNNEIDYTNTLL
jgi:hypothetical protein